MNKLTTISLVVCLFTLAGLLTAPLAAAQDRTIVCEEENFRIFSQRVHVKCAQEYDGIRYFVVAKSDAVLLATLNVVREMLPTESVLRITYDPADLSGVGIGCKANDCRLIKDVQFSEKPYIEMFDVAGESRRALIYPAVSTVNDPPLLIYFHGRGGDVDDSAERRKFDELWPEAVIVYAEGTKVGPSGLSSTTDNRLAWTLRFPYKFAMGQTKDFDYVRTLLERISENHTTDPERVYASGHSSGGFFTLSLMELMPANFAAFVVVGSYARYKVELKNQNDMLKNKAAPLQLSTSDRAPLPKPVLYVFGKNDTAFNNDGPDQVVGWSSNPQVETRSKFTLRQLMTRNNCQNVPIGTNYWVSTQRFDCSLNPFGAVVSWQLHNGGHSWPTTANDWAIDFFKSH